jgi:hypothetical protein
MPAGYSGTPLARKLGIKPGFNLCVYAAPRNYLALLSPLPEAINISGTAAPSTDLFHVFETQEQSLARALRKLVKLLKPNGIIWVSWPKKSANVPSEITENTIRELALPLGLVDIKVCAVDETWSGLKLVWRKENRK